MVVGRASLGAHAPGDRQVALGLYRNALRTKGGNHAAYSAAYSHARVSAAAYVGADLERAALHSGVRDTTGEDLGLLEHPAPNVESGDVVMLADGREALVTATLEAAEAMGLTALLQVVVAPSAGEETQ